MWATQAEDEQTRGCLAFGAVKVAFDWLRLTLTRLYVTALVFRHFSLPFRFLQGIIKDTMPAKSKQTKRPACDASWPSQLVDQRLGSSAQCFDTLGAKVFANPSTAFRNSHALNVCPELPLGVHIRVAHIMPKTGRFAATFTFSHCYYPLEQSPSGEDLQHKGDQPSVAVKKFTTTGALAQGY
jgi:hypothetical protein